MNTVLASLIAAGSLVLGLVLFVLLSAACEVGFQIGRRRAGAARTEAAALGALIGGMLTLLAFILGLSINFAQNRFEDRRELVATEANTIGTAWLRAKMIGGPDGEAIAGLVEQYANTRLEFTKSERGAPVGRLIATTHDEQAKIWLLASTVARRSPTAISATLINALNQMFDASLAQRFAFDGRVPDDMLAVLMLSAVIAIGALGYQVGLGGGRQPIMAGLLILMWALGMVLTVDLNRPRLGAIRVDVAPLQWTIKSFDPRPLAAGPPAP